MASPPDEEKTAGLAARDLEKEDSAAHPVVTTATAAAAAATLPSTPSEEPDAAAKLYSIFTHREKTAIIITAAGGALLSPLTATYSLSTLNPLAAAYGVSPALVNLTLTTYLVLQGLSPAFLGSLSDAAGRRPAFLACLAAYLLANAGLALQRSFAALLVLRCLQSAAISPCIALGFGVAGDIATPAERGTYAGWINSGAMLGPALGPVVGALLAQYLGWRADFWFLVVLAGVALVAFALFFPETSRAVVGDGSVAPPKWNRPLWGLMRDAVRQRRRRRRRQAKGEPVVLSREDTRASLPQRKRMSWPNPFRCLRVIAEKDVGLLLLCSAILYTAFYAVISSVPFLFHEAYGFNDIQIGLSYLPYGGGVLIATFASGKLMDWNFRRLARKTGLAIVKGRATDLRAFPIEKARFQIVLPMILLGAIATLVYGWVLEYNAHVVGPLILLFFVGLFLTSAFQSASVILVDYYPSAPATATAANNLCRCLMAAAASAVINILIQKMGRGWSYTLVAFIAVSAGSMLLVLIKYGPAWRERRRLKAEMKAQRKSERADRTNST